LNRVHLYALALILTAIGLGLFLYKVLALRFPLAPEAEVFVWNVEAKVTFTANHKPVKVSLLIPRSTKRYAVTNDAFVSRGYGITTTTQDDNRLAVWSIRKANGLQTLYYRAEVRRADTKPPVITTPRPQVEKPVFKEAELAAAEDLASRITKRSADHETMAADLLRRLNQPQPPDSVALLLGKQPSNLDKADLAVRILGLTGVPARVVHGVQLKEQKEKAPLLHWLEVWEKNRWQALDPATASVGVPDSYMAWWRGPQPLVQLEGGEALRVTISMARELEDAIQTAVIRGEITKPLLLKFSLLSLPVHTQQVYRVLLMVPVGGFILVILRNLVGITTFGTFMPVLMALAFRETQLLWGIVFFSSLVALGLLIRFYLENLKLLLVPRLAAVLTVVVILMGLMSIFTYKLGIERGLSVGLFPMVILTMTIERMSVVWEERGSVAAIKQGLGSLGAAALAYLVMHQRTVQHLFFVFPELLLVLLAVTLLLGRYTGFRLLELWRFKPLVKKEK
jgi:hypothetical protein